MPFWSAANVVPKRNHRFLVTVGGLPVPQYTAKTVSKPVFNVNNVEHNFLSHKFNFPGMVTWDPVEMTFVDGAGATDNTNSPPVFVSDDSNNAKNFYNAIIGSGYLAPANMDATTSRTFNKSAATFALGSVLIQQIGDDSTVLDEFQLVNPWLEKIDFGSLSYEDDGITEISVTFRYDYALFGGINATSTTLVG
tara:strand:+ start:357 stop:938 length:582 start_codon:yes stop_codon:yes gene_type:complete